MTAFSRPDPRALVSAPGPLEATRHGLAIPHRVETLEEARAILHQLNDTAALRELSRAERHVQGRLRRMPGVHQPAAPHEFTAIAKARVRRLSKAAKRARAAQRSMAGTRSRLQDARAAEWTAERQA